MNSFYKALEQGRHISRCESWNKQTWKQFMAELEGKKVFVYGAGALLDMLLDRYMKNITIEAVIDTDKWKHKICVADYSFYASDKSFTYQYIVGEDIFEKYRKEEIAVVVSSINYYEEIVDSLMQKGICNIYIALIMCANEKEKVAIDDYSVEKYARESMELPIEHKKLVFRTMGRYCGHGRAIAEVLLSRTNDLDIVWIVDNATVFVPEGIRVVYQNNVRQYVEEMQTAGFWIMEHPVPKELIKREDQCYIQIKHWAAVTLKSFGKTLHAFRKEQVRVEEWERNGELMDYIFVGSPFDEKTCREGFDFKGEAVYVGSPRSDILFRENEMKEKIYGIYGIDRIIHTILYAPTFRVEGDRYDVCKDVLELTSIDFSSLKQAVEKRFGGKWEILLRLHPTRNKLPKEYELPQFVHNVTGYDDSEELVAASDIMITDYSSIMFEPAFVKKTVFLYAPDRKEYIDGERGLLIDYDSLPFDIAEDNEKLVQNIYNFRKEEYDRRVDTFMEKYGVHEDGHASERAAGFILDLVRGNEMEKGVCNRLCVK